jgi:hypothetical protein
LLFKTGNIPAIWSFSVYPDFRSCSRERLLGGDPLNGDSICTARGRTTSLGTDQQGLLKIGNLHPQPQRPDSLISLDHFII